MHELQSLRLSATLWFSLPRSELTLRKVLAGFVVTFASIPRHSKSLTTLVLDNVSVGDAITRPIALPSLTTFLYLT